jgi:hypothetical protein
MAFRKLIEDIGEVMRLFTMLAEQASSKNGNSD